MSARPRPVTATVTKPPWMCLPDADAAMYRCSSLSSGGSTASLTSVLDHDSYISEPDSEEEKDALNSEALIMRGDCSNTVIKPSPHFALHPPQPKKRVRHTAETALVEDSTNLRCNKSSEFGLSAWEMWLIQKAKEERRLRRMERQKVRQEKLDEMAKEREKKMKEEKAQEVRKEWLHKKMLDERLTKKMEKLRIENEKRLKEETEQTFKSKAESRFAEWVDSKREEERLRKEREKEKKLKEERAQAERQKLAEEKYQEWLKNNRNRPKSAPLQCTGYNNNAPYPRPGYINPVPWQHPAVPKVKPVKPKKSRPRKYVWNPEKYF